MNHFLRYDGKDVYHQTIYERKIISMTVITDIKKYFFQMSFGKNTF